MKNYNEAQIAIQRQLSKEIDWFNESDERHFNPAVLIGWLAKELFYAFVAYLVQLAQKKAKEEDIDIFKILKTKYKNLFKGKKSADSEKLEKHADQIPSIIKELNNDQIHLYLDKTEDNLRLHFEDLMPSDRATLLARTIRQSVEKELLKHPKK